VQAFYRSVLWLESHDDPKWRKLPPAELGGVAKYVAVEDDLPRDTKDVDLEVTAAPAEPRKACNAGAGVLPYLVILGVGAGLYLAFWAAMRPTADYLAFEAAKGGGPAGLRAYLVDDRNTMYRDDAKRLLAAHYEPALRKAEAVKDPALKQGLTDVLNGLKESPSPATSLDVLEKWPGDNPLPGAADRTKRLRTELADALGTHLGKELIAFVMPPDGKPAHVELAYEFVPEGRPGQARFRVNWRLRFRPTPDAAAVEGPVRVLPTAYDTNNFTGLLNGGLPQELKQEVFQELFGVAAPFVPQVPPGGGDWSD
jgi:hypothetical protein